MITELTPEQEALLPVYRDRWIAIGNSTEPTDRAQAELGLQLAYKAAGLECPTDIRWFPSPSAMEQARPAGTSRLSGVCWGQMDAGWLAHYEYFREVLGLVEETEPLVGLTLIAKSAGWWIPFDTLVLISDRPTAIHLDERGRLHNLKGQALSYADGWGLYRVHGIAVDKRFVLEPESLTVADIEAENNLEVRRTLIDMYGPERYMADSGAKLVHEDDWGQLFVKEQAADEPLTMVKVTNSTQEPDGTYKDYWLRVHPELRPMSEDGSFGEPQPLTALNAVASTFGLTGEAYAQHLVLQT